jgi:hypothetical protein
MIEAFEAYYSQSFKDKDWRNETGVWAAAWKAAKAQPAQEPLDIEDLAYSAYEEAMSYGLNRDVFVRYFKKIADHGIGGKA